MKEKRRKRIIKVLITIPVLYVLMSFITIVVFKYVQIPYTPLMALRYIEHRKDSDYRTQKEWKPLSEIGQEMAMAAMSFEDFRFMKHKGFDWEFIGDAWRDYKRGVSKRGASSISQQSAKNVFLLPFRSWIRKGLEGCFTVGIEWIWGKERILEVYLNVVETGHGLFGVEAAAQCYFQKPSKELTQREAALIASSLPNPRNRSPLSPTTEMLRKVTTIEMIMSWLPVPDWLLQQSPSGFEQELQPTSSPQDSSGIKEVTLSWSVYGDDGYDYVKINLPEQFPFRSFQEINPNKIVVELLGVSNKTTWIAQFPTKTIRNVYHQHSDNNTMRVVIEIGDNLHWGHSVYYEDSRLVIRVKHQPRLKIKGLRITLDAGHGGEVNGAIGKITGLKEKDVNLEMVMQLKGRLEKKGATVLLTRSDDSDVSMEQRLRFLSWQLPDILVSFHNNAAINPAIQGTSTYYRHIGFRPLSAAIHNRLLELDIQNAGNIGSFDFALNGATDYPNVLIEGLFLSNPTDESKLTDKRFQKKFVNKIVKGLEDFLKAAK